MPFLYLSPSTQEYNDYVTDGTEEEWMNRLADAMEPYLISSGIQFTRNTPDMTAATSIAASNAGNYDLHLALHSNAAGEGQSGTQRGIIAFYFPGSWEGYRAARLFADGLKEIYPLPERVRAEPTVTIGEVRRTRAPAVLLELGFHDNPEDADWIVTHIDEMAEDLVRSLTEYFGIPFFSPAAPLPGVVRVEFGALSIYSRPDSESPLLARAYDGAEVIVYGEYEGWYLLRFGDAVGYAAADFILLV